MKIRKFITFLSICSILMLSTIPATMANARSSGVVLDIDVQTLSDQSGRNIVVTPSGNIQTGSSFTNIYGSEVPYMTTATSNVVKNDGKSGCLSVTDESITKLTDCTIETWMRFHLPESSAIYPKVFLQRSSAKNIYQIEMTSSGNKAGISENYVLTNTFGSASVNEQWCHYVFTFDAVYDGSGNITAVKPKIYLNGVYTASNYATEPSVTGSTYMSHIGTGTEFLIGGYTGLGFPADFATFKIYDTVKTADEISDIYNAEKASYVETSVDPSVITFEDGSCVAGSEGVSLNMPDVTVSFTDDADMGTVNENTLKLVDVSDGLPVDYSVSISGTDAVVSTLAPLDKNKKYRIELTEDILTNSGETYGQFLADFKTVRGVYADEGWNLEKNGNTITAPVSVLSDNPSDDYAKHILSVYQICDGYVLPVIVIESESSNVTSGSDLSLNTTLPTMPAGDYRAVSMIWGQDAQVCELNTKSLDFSIESVE